MEIMEGIRAALKELIVPELDRIKEENREIRAILEVTNKRLDDVNTHLADQSRRIDSVREELGQRIDSAREELGQRIDSAREELGQRIDSVREKLGQRTDSLREELGQRIDSLREELGQRIDSLREELSNNIKETNNRIDRLYEVIVRREEHQQVALRLTDLEREVREIKRQLAA